MLDIQSIDVNIGATPILRGVTLEVPSGSMCGLIGRNGGTTQGLALSEILMRNCVTFIST